MRTILTGKFRISFQDNHDVAAILEVMVMNVYKINKIKPGNTVLDLGAGLGEFTLSSSKRVGNTGLVIAVEPNPNDFKVLLKNLKDNKIENVIPINKAISDNDKDIELSFKGYKFNAAPLTVERLDSILKEHNKTSLDVIKMDIEGAETLAVNLLNKYLLHVNYLPIELHATKSQIDSVLIPLGFKFNRISRNEYLRNALKYAIFHPASALKLYRIFNSTGENPGGKKIIKGIEISKSENLIVGYYYK